MIFVSVASVKGSTPREVGAVMTVYHDHHEGTIGGGALEFEALIIAREMILTGETARVKEFILGPHLGQCCGGVVELSFSTAPQKQVIMHNHLYIFGQGPTGKALLNALTPLPFQTHAHDERHGDDLESIIRDSPLNAIYFIMTHSHALDYALCEQILRGKSPKYVGLIGSDTKRARFINYYVQKCGKHAELVAFHCPIGIKTSDKTPEIIASLTAADLLIKNLHN
jgi:xanthine dehydrogenase accessory factor